MVKEVTTIPNLPPRPTNAHKGTFGKLLVVGGSRGMIGAPSLAANAALRSGAGLLRVAVPEGVQLSVAGLSPCATTIPLAQDGQGLISTDAVNQILTALDENDCLAIGPGLGQSVALQGVMASIIENCQLPTVIDADGLNNLAALRGIGSQLNANTVLTPHPGEMKRLWQGWLREDMPSDRRRQALMLAQQCGAVVVLKGAGTVVTDGKRIYVNTTGNGGMATAGTGDVLTGMIVALLAQKMEPFDAAVLAVHVHGLAGDLSANELTQIAMIATDLIDYLPAAWKTCDF